MARARKTVEVQTIKDHINKALSIDLSQDQKNALCWALELVLHESNSYKGFKYLFDWTAATDEFREDHNYDRYYF